MMSDFWARQKAGSQRAIGKALHGVVHLGRYPAVKGRVFAVDVEQ